ncbi:hypothetical protein HELRODRAFT_190537, partial [Helobdella robusta]|uniref:Voltage-dependent calcium channel gamma-5 subunit n=1 Tax=Helobdella robusta TaxID=6412 RepID=T1FS30_HELRO
MPTITSLLNGKQHGDHKIWKRKLCSPCYVRRGFQEKVPRYKNVQFDGCHFRIFLIARFNTSMESRFNPTFQTLTSLNNKNSITSAASDGDVQPNIKKMTVCIIVDRSRQNSGTGVSLQSLSTSSARPVDPGRCMEGDEEKGCWRNPKALTLATSMCACASFSFLCVAVATDYWLYAEDRIEFTNQTGYYVKTYNGLWRKCTLDVKKSPERNCSYIPYLRYMEREDLKPSESVLRQLSLRRASMFPIASLIILLVGEVACFIGQCTRRNVLTFISGILFVIGGLCTLIGVIVFISAVTEEASSSRPKSTL